MKYPVIFIAIICLISCKNKSTQSSSSHQRVDISIEDAHEIRNAQPSVIFLDVRTPEEIAQGFITDALTADVKSPDFRERIQKLDKDREYIVYCRSGGRSVKASDMMLEEGFTKVKNMKGGYNAWKEKYQ